MIVFGKFMVGEKQKHIWGSFALISPNRLFRQSNIPPRKFQNSQMVPFLNETIQLIFGSFQTLQISYSGIITDQNPTLLLAKSTISTELCQTGFLTIMFA
jgi:hypothetical protein